MSSFTMTTPGRFQGRLACRGNEKWKFGHGDRRRKRERMARTDFIVAILCRWHMECLFGRQVAVWVGCRRMSLVQTVADMGRQEEGVA
jgi:hypothetical protein